MVRAISELLEIGYWELGGMVVETRRCVNVLRADFSKKVIRGEFNTPKYLFEHLDVLIVNFSGEFPVIMAHNHLGL